MSSDVTVVPWVRRFSRLRSRWPSEDKEYMSAFMLRGLHEPYDLEPSSYAVLAAGDLIGRFSFRVTGQSAFVGLYLHAGARGRGYGLHAARGSLIRVYRETGVRFAWCSVAGPNKAALWLNAMIGYRRCGFMDWRLVPDGFNVDWLTRWPSDEWRYLPEMSVRYHRLEIDLSLFKSG